MITQLNEYQDLMQRTYKPNRLMNHILGLVGEAGECGMPIEAMQKVAKIAELVKKAEFHGKPYESEKMEDELGDVLWYLTAMAIDHNLSLENIANRNYEKLCKRYPEGFVKGGGIR